MPLAAVHLSADNSLRILNRDSSLTLLYFDDTNDYNNAEDHEYDQCDNTHASFLKLYPDFLNSRRQSRDDTCEDDQRDPVSDTVIVDLLTEPHEKCGSCGKYEYDHCYGENIRADQRLSEQSDGNADRLHDCQQHRQISGVLCNFLSSLRTFSCQPFQGRNCDGQELKYDGGCDVWCDTQREYRKVTERASRKQIEQSKSPVSLLKVCERTSPVNSRNRDLRPDPEYEEHQKGKIIFFLMSGMFQTFATVLSISIRSPRPFLRQLLFFYSSLAELMGLYCQVLLQRSVAKNLDTVFHLFCHADFFDQFRRNNSTCIKSV